MVNVMTANVKIFNSVTNVRNGYVNSVITQFTNMDVLKYIVKTRKQIFAMNFVYKDVKHVKNTIGFNNTHKCVTNVSEVVPFSNEILILVTENKRSAEGSIDEQKNIKRPRKWSNFNNFNDKVQIRLNQMNKTLKKFIKK